MKKRFTLIELLLVIVVIAILAGLLLPAIGKVRASAKEAAVRADVVSLTTAVKQIESTYSNFRKVLSSGYFDANGKIKGGADGYYPFLAELIKPNDSSTTIKFNTRRIKMLDSKNKVATGNFGWVEPREYLDKKENPPKLKRSEYEIYIDTDYDGKVTVNGTDYFKTVVVVAPGDPNDEEDDIMLDS